ncbi:MAG: cobyrinate a,c-diamide synthase, partial [Desulfamplus sp.]|nr:cobyrinate a,c-diamide synthase [Desulfamplus sp.]
MKGFVIAGTGSGSGKTTLCLGILAYLSKIGYKVAPFKVGPDFIDPGHHTALTGKTSRNLDSWMLSRSTNMEIFAKGCEKADIAVVEGVMGLFDGYSGTSEAGSTAQMAKWLGLPVILVVDARSMARSAAAIVQGFENFDPELEFAGVIFSKTGSQRHYAYLKEALEANCRMKCLGHLPRNPDIAMPERHLGLVTSDEHTLASNTVEKLVEMIDRYTSLREMVENLHGTMPHHFPLSHHSPPLTVKMDMELQQNIRIAVARDKAFCFYYQENIEALQRYGASIVEFSPITSSSLPSDIHGIYFGGGYPELFAQELSSNTTLMDQIRQRSLQGMPIYGECGGFMYLCKDITGMNEIQEAENKDSTKKYPMTGCFPFSAVMSKKMR